MNGNVNYFLAETNRIKLGGYVSIRVQLVYDLVDFIYQDNLRSVTSLKRKLSHYNRYDANSFSFSSFTKSMIHEERYLATLNSNPVLRILYTRALTNSAYKEMCFILFILGIVNSLDYLKYNTDVGYVTGRFTLIRGMRDYGTKGLLQTLEISYTCYADLMCMYIKNSSEGINYGFSPYDFVYHLLNASDKRKKDYLKYNKYAYCIKKLKSLDLKDLKCFNFNKSMLVKYTEEVAVLLPVLSRVCKVDSFIGYLLDNIPVQLSEVLLLDKDFIRNTGMVGIQYS